MNPDISMKSFASLEFCRWEAIRIAAMVETEIYSRGLKKRTFGNTGDGPGSKYRRVLGEAIKITLA